MTAIDAPGDFPVVYVGGSAGGRDAYIRLLQHLPADMGVAIVIVNHLRLVATQLREILPRFPAMPRRPPLLFSRTCQRAPWPAAAMILSYYPKRLRPKILQIAAVAA